MSLDPTTKELAVSAWLDTPLGPMLAVATGSELLLLEFETRRGLSAAVEQLSSRR